VGGHLARWFARDHDVLALKHGDLDIADRLAVKRCVTDARPDLVINCAVLQVDECERDPARAQAVNVDGPRYLAEAANAVGAELVQFSTQYVFEGEPVGRNPYTTRDETRPVNVYGAAKLAGERATRNACPRTYIVRTSWVYGSGKNSFLCTVAADLAAGKRVRAIDDIWSSTTYVEDLIERVALILARRRYGVYHIVNAGVCTYYEFALEAGRLAGLEPESMALLVEITHERDMKRDARRPRYTPLRCLLSEEIGLPPMRHWRQALAQYLKKDPE